MTTSGRLSETEISVASTNPSSSDDGFTAPPVNTETAKQAAGEAKQVANEAKVQAKHVLSQAKQELEQQAGQSRDKLTSTLRSLGDEMQKMAENGSSDGLAAQTVRKLADTARGSADYLEQRDPASLVDELREFARRRPNIFLANAAVAGGVAGRLTRSAVDQKTASSSAPNSSYNEMSSASYDPTFRNADAPIADSTYEALAQTEGMAGARPFDPTGDLRPADSTGAPR